VVAPQDVLRFLLSPEARDLRPLLVQELVAGLDLYMRSRVRAAAARLSRPRLPLLGVELPAPPVSASRAPRCWNQLDVAVLFDMQNRKFGPYLTTRNRILASVSMMQCGGVGPLPFITEMIVWLMAVG
jgi:hypothetical protein